MFELGAEVVTLYLEGKPFQFDLEEPDVGGPTSHLKTGLVIDSDPDAITINPDADGVLVRYEYIIVDAEKETSRCVLSTSLNWEW